MSTQDHHHINQFAKKVFGEQAAESVLVIEHPAGVTNKTVADKQAVFIAAGAADNAFIDWLYDMGFIQEPWINSNYALFIRHYSPSAPAIHVLIPAYNCGEFIQRCLESVNNNIRQMIARDAEVNYSVLVIDDAGTEPGFSETVMQLCRQYGFQYLRNPVNRKCPYNLWLGVKTLDADPDDVVFILDGDDFLPDNALQRIREVYTDPQVWLTYGQYQPYPHNTGQVLAQPYPEEVLQARQFRKSPVGNLYNHPLTFRKFLFQQIRLSDFKTPDGRWFRGGYDFVIMIPMMEMAGKEHLRFLDEVLYMYNAVNPISDSSINVPLVKESWAIKEYPGYDPLFL